MKTAVTGRHGELRELGEVVRPSFKGSLGAPTSATPADNAASERVFSVKPVWLAALIPVVIVVAVLIARGARPAAVTPTQPPAATVQAPAPAVRQALPPLSATPPSEITLEQVTRAEPGPTPTLHFRDGSVLAVDNYVMGQLPENIRLQFTYTRPDEGPQDVSGTGGSYGR